MWRTLLLFGLFSLCMAGCKGGSSPGLDDSLPNAPSSEIAQLVKEIEASPVPDGVDPGLWLEMKSAMASSISALDKVVSGPPMNEASVPQISLDSITGELGWGYFSSGDYDQNGEVNLSDMTPLAIHFGKAGPFDPDSIEAIVDGDGNGEINLADITTIAVNYFNTVNGYSVYSSTSFLDFPREYTGPNGFGAQLVANVGFTSSVGDPNSQRLAFSHTLSDNPVGTMYWVRPNDGTDDGIASTYTVPEGDTLTPDGGAVQIDGIVFSIQPSTLVGDVQFTHEQVPVPAGLPVDITPVGLGHDINVDNPEWLNVPVVLRFPYDDTGLENEENLVVLHYDDTDGYSPTTLLNVDTYGNVISIDTRSFSKFVIGFISELALQSLPASYTTGFDPKKDGWEIQNFGSFYAGGNCLGMAAYSVWFNENRPEDLWGKFPTTGGAPTSIAHLTASRAHLAQGQYWAFQFQSVAETLGEKETGTFMKYFLNEFKKPLIIGMKDVASGARHAAVLYGWDYNENSPKYSFFQIYDSNHPGDRTILPWISTGGFGSYGWGGDSKYTVFSFIAMPSLGRTEDFAGLTVEAEGGFTTSSGISLSSPAHGEAIVGRDMQLSGELAGSLVDVTTIVCYIEGIPYSVPVSGGSFDATLSVSPGENTLILLAGASNPVNQSNWHLNGATLVRTVTAASGNDELRVTMTYNSAVADVGLYVHEPWGGEACNPFNPTSLPSSMYYYPPSRVAFGPVRVVLNTAEGGEVTPGEFKIYVHYNSEMGHIGDLTGNVSVLSWEGTPKQKHQNYPFRIKVADPWNADPDDIGPDWAYITRLTLEIPQPQ